MPIFNKIFVFFFFHAFLKFNNMHDVFGIQHGQSYNTLLERKHLTPHGYSLDEYIINKHTVANLHLLVSSSLDAGIGRKQVRMPLYELNVCLLKKMDGLDGWCDWRRELAEVLTKWHDTFKHVNKTKGGPMAGMALSTAQVIDVDDRLL